MPVPRPVPGALGPVALLAEWRRLSGGGPRRVSRFVASGCQALPRCMAPARAGFPLEAGMDHANAGGLIATAWLVAALCVAGAGAPAPAAERGRTVPAPALDLPAGQGAADTVVLAGGCFWGVQGVFQHIEGVTSAVSGYAGGEKRLATYERVSTGGTGHAESVEVTYDPRRTSLGRLLQVFFGVAHDPTQRNRQGPDLGPQYRSAIFPSSARQAAIARAYIAQLDRARAFEGTIATTLEPDRPFFPAEGYHQDFLARNTWHPYVVANDLP